MFIADMFGEACKPGGVSHIEWMRCRLPSKRPGGCAYFLESLFPASNEMKDGSFPREGEGGCAADAGARTSQDDDFVLKLGHCSTLTAHRTPLQ